MKIRIGFVSNSSSSSFTVRREDLTELQYIMIINHIQAAKMLKDNSVAKCRNTFDVDPADYWLISEENGMVKGRTSMDNFDMYAFLTLIGVDDNKVHWNY